MDNGELLKNTNQESYNYITIPFEFFIYQPYLFVREKS